MTVRTIVTTVSAVVTGMLVVAAPAQADPVDDSFLSALNSAGIGYNDPGSTVELGQTVCPMLVEPGKSFASVASQMRGNNNGISPEMASFFTGIAISMYCPQMVSSISDGSILNNLNTLDMLSGIGGLGGFPGFFR